MASLSFALLPEAASQFYDMLSCLAKFSDTVSIEAREDRLLICTLNSSRSGYAGFTLDYPQFFSEYSFNLARPTTSSTSVNKYSFRILNKALISAFRSRVADQRTRNTTVDKWVVTVQDRLDETECRLVIQAICNGGITKTYRLTFEEAEVTFALFEKNEAKNCWVISSTMLKENTDFFGPRAEQLDICHENGKISFISFTEKIVNAKKEVLKHPLQTTIAINAPDFEECEVLEQLHITISVKEFRSVVAHAASLNVSLRATYSRPSRPLQFSYGLNGVKSQFILMTAGEYRGPQVQPTAQEPLSVLSRPTNITVPITADNTMGAPPVPRMAQRKPNESNRALGRVSPVKAKAVSQQNETLFVRDDDEAWDPPNFDTEESVRWDASGDFSQLQSFRDSGTVSGQSAGPATENVDTEVPATQRVSQIRGLWG
ncbi:DNA repair protein Rad9 [Eremomyces bilateralis CBS 781.70]|uniref:DNA repair protein rad9 n=1 Tax=Eremomyces bilateralis CBS 781.70 TaxID=1392243 RepID=A0A6G1G4P5_9PEZI|nr:DNA repair protein Rad9 [Eremomyces bilateralis CBS 781.70]KAF1812988.1 DNA repair protein Rad9 [Eremomyces bilateralis CBS 781.70]